MSTVSIKNNSFEYIQYDASDEIEVLHKIKHFCGDDVTITLKTCDIDDFWCVELYDCQLDKTRVVPSGDYIVKIFDVGYTVVSQHEFMEYFQVTD